MVRGWAGSRREPRVREDRPEVGSNRELAVSLVRKIEDVSERSSKAFAARCEPDRVHVCAHEILVREIQPWRLHLSGNHPVRSTEEVLVVRVADRGIVENERRLSASPGATRPLRVVR